MLWAIKSETLQKLKTPSSFSAAFDSLLDTLYEFNLMLILFLVLLYKINQFFNSHIFAIFSIYSLNVDRLEAKTIIH